ncbi:DUF6531 domain-containing protein [Acidovorax sp. SUPP2522]|uniref:RHS repeat-associated core domain-containing protein n=2 Tax=Acidovorax TaxID=12916 RepID=UPI00234A3DEA|nr:MULTISPECIES: RHS repeat-associated core domain-containing protein [unclassified Acidovorax]WCM98405.1 DUF6531 domain-containing protein [Acidovorax sp. GBBC 1281]GKT14118.1 DUF6531 domain-containing protein [Acidovorax sp. SUPP2522]
MSGKPAARQSDMTQKGGPIVQGSATVLIGSAGGVACSVCPGGMAVGSPVNPALGAKVLMGGDELDFSLPGPMPLVWQRQYSSYVNEEHGATCGLLGYGWKLPMEIAVRLEAGRTVLLDTGGRAITFGEPLAPGEALYSASEDLWLMRGGGAGSALPAGAPASRIPSELQPWAWQPRWAHVPQEARADARCVIAASGNGGAVWLLWPGEDGHHRVGRVLDRFGRSQHYGYDEHGRLAGITDGSGRRYALHYNREREGAAAAAPTTATATAHPLLGPDSGERLTGVDCVHNPLDAACTGPGYRVALVRYRYDSAGDLVEVLGRDGQRTREFGYDRVHRMVRHRVRSGPLHTYVYEDQGVAMPRPGARVVEQHNEQGLSYLFEYRDPPAIPPATPAAIGQSETDPATPDPDTPQPVLQPVPVSEVRVRDSLNRLTRYHFEGAGGDKRLVRLVLPDGAEQRDRYDSAGRRVARTDPLGRTTWWRYDGAGRLLGTQHPDGRSTRYRWGEAGSAQDGLLLQSVGLGALPTHMDYDAWGRLRQVTVGDPQGLDAPALATRFEYAPLTAEGAIDPATRPWCDQPVAVIDAQGGRKELAYNGCGQLTRHTDCSGRVHAWHYGAFGEVRESIDALNQRTRYQYDGAGRPTRVMAPDGSQVQYRWGPNGELQAATHGAQPVGDGTTTTVTTSVTYGHDLWGRVIAQTQAGQGFALRYDVAGRLVELINENQAVTRFVHDVQDRLVQEVGFDGRVQAYGYDAAGQLVHQRDGHGAGHHPGVQGAAAQGLGATVRSRSHYDDGGRIVARVLVRSAGLQSDEPDETLQIHAYEHDRHGALAAARTWTAHLPWSQAQAKAHSLGEQWLDVPAPLLQALLALGATSTGEPDPALAEAAQRLQAQRLIADTRVALERDPFGRATGEAQTLYRQAPATPHLGGEPEPEFEHRIAHRLGALGQRLGSQLQGLGELDWLAYGSGHVHGLLLDKTPVLAIERDALHREVARTLQLDSGAERVHAAVIQTRRLDPMGRLLQQDWQGLPRTTATGAAQASGPLGTLSVRRYTYDALGQLVGVQTPLDATRYHYDVHQRLTGVAHAVAEGVQQRRWRLDPAGNRLPDRLGQDAAPGADRQDWASQVQQNLHDPGFDLLAPPGSAQGRPGGPVDQWPGNRIGWSGGKGSGTEEETIQYRYDAFGNRVQARHADGRTLRLEYDALHQLTAVSEQARGDKGFTPIARYRYDAFGRRLGKTVVREGREDTTHYGWDADRLVHTQDGQGIRHTVYEPASFVPLLQLQRRQGAKDAMQTLMDLGAEPGEGTTEAADSFAGMPRMQREMVQAALQSVLDAATGAKALARAQAHMPAELAQLMAASVSQLKDERQAQAKDNPLTIRHYLCDHLGTPIGLVDGNGEKAGQVTWAASYGAWGDVQEEYNPHRIEQNIRFQGQQIDAETGLHYNRFRYYDPHLGQYITQDPIGLDGGVNKYIYPLNPIIYVDPLGLTETTTPELANQDGRASGVNKVIGIKKGGEKINNGAKKMEGANKKDMDVYDCIMSGPACSKSSAEMEDMRESARKERIQGMKDIGQGSVDVYKSTPGTLGNGIPGGRIPKP